MWFLFQIAIMTLIIGSPSDSELTTRAFSLAQLGAPERATPKRIHGRF
jgi:hypothetical protein